MQGAQFFCVADIGGCYINPTCVTDWTCNPEGDDGFTCQCPESDCDTEEVDGLKYHVFGERVTWLEAKENCEDRGYILASFLTEDDFDAARAFVTT